MPLHKRSSGDRVTIIDVEEKKIKLIQFTLSFKCRIRFVWRVDKHEEALQLSRLQTDCQSTSDSALFPCRFF
jgi:hypothetical protein